MANRCENSTIDPIATQKYCRRGSTWDVSLPPLPVYHILYHIPVRWAHRKNPDVQIQPGCLSEAAWRYEKKVLIYALSLTFENIWEALPYFMVNIALFYIVVDIHHHSPVIVIVVSPQVCQDIHPSRSRHSWWSAVKRAMIHGSSSRLSRHCTYQIPSGKQT